MNSDVKGKVSGRPGARSPGGFYGWWILAIAILLFAVSAVGQTQGFSVLLVPLRGNLDIDPTVLAITFLVGGLLGALILPIMGRVMDERGAKIVLVWAFGAYVIALVLLALVPSQAASLGALLVLRLICSTALWLGASVLVTLWFRRRRGFALGLLVGVGASLLTICAYGLSVLIESQGVRVSLLLFAGFLLIAILPLLIWGVVNRPGLLHQQPDGDDLPEYAAEGRAEVDMRDVPLDDSDMPGMTAAEAFRTPLAWVITAAGALQAFVVTGYLFNEAVIFMQQGATAHDAARSLVPQAVTNTVTVLVVSTLVDRFRMRWMVTAATAQLVLCLWWGFNLDSLGPTWLFASSLGVCLGLIFGYALAFFPRFYGVRHVGEIRGRFGAYTAVAAALGTVVFTYIDVDSAHLMMWIVGVVAAVIAIASWMVPWPTPVDEMRLSPTA